MRVTVHRSESLDAGALALVRVAGVGPLLRRSGEALGVPATAGLAVRLTDDAELRRLNAAHAGIDATTDVLAFPGEGAQNATAGGWIGDVAISVERARAQNPARPSDELRILAVHGFLHCLGHDHDRPDRAARMAEATRSLLPGVELPELEAHPQAVAGAPDPLSVSRPVTARRAAHRR
jgi:probable rRNA maturation factor